MFFVLGHRLLLPVQRHLEMSSSKRLRLDYCLGNDIRRWLDEESEDLGSGSEGEEDPDEAEEDKFHESVQDSSSEQEASEGEKIQREDNEANVESDADGGAGDGENRVKKIISERTQLQNGINLDQTSKSGVVSTTL